MAYALTPMTSRCGCCSATFTALGAVADLAKAEPENGYLQYRLSHVLAEAGDADAAIRMLDAAVSHVFLSAQLLRQEEVFAISSVRHQNDYLAVTERLDANVERCRSTYAGHLHAAVTERRS